MNALKQIRLVLRAGLAIALASVALAAMAQAADPAWIASSKGSSAHVGDTVALLGGGFTGQFSITIAITDPAGNRSTRSAEVDVKGAISVPLFLNQPGFYKAEAINGDGQVVAMTLVSSTALPD